MSSKGGGPTYLRVRRRRNAEASSTLRLEGFNKKKRRTSYEIAEGTGSLWRRVESHDDDDDRRHIPTKKRNNSLVLDAVMEVSHQSKKRRLTLLPAKNVYKVLNPAERMVDDSLKEVVVGNLDAGKHLALITSDPRLAEHAQRWLTWKQDYGSLLHACALWNSVEAASELLQATQHRQTLFDIRDKQDCTAHQVATMAGHEQICQVMEAFGFDPEDDNQFVVDIYCLQEEEEDGQRVMIDDGWQLEIENGDLESGDEDQDDSDSNHEDFTGNDYPEEEHEEVDEEWEDPSEIQELGEGQW
jgi:hypothetical protein